MAINKKNSDILNRQYFIMRKNDVLTVADFTTDGIMLRYSQNFQNEKKMPLQSKSETDWLKQWWKLRSIPIGQGKVREMLERKGLFGPEDYLIRNLGLSLTDYYWLKPVGSELCWEDVNLFDNDFREDLLHLKYDNSEKEGTPGLTPNGSLQGQLEKTWMINEHGERILVKGNRDRFSGESLNEVIAGELHKLQGYDNYTPYSLLEISGRPYDYGCYSKAFTSQKLELVSAYAVVTSEKKQNDISQYENFIRICGKHGIDTEQLRRDLEYQIMTDYILTGTDRHLSNISVLRDADSLRFLRVAPIYDSGKCLFVDMQGVPSTAKDMLEIEVTSFAATEQKLLSYVTDRSLVDATLLPSPEYIRSMYEKDSHMSRERVNSIVRGYEIKLDLFRSWQLGGDIRKISVGR
ncbi:MAG: phosphatidylinositol 4-kinase [Lachnospiraceae bacterium]|nr:phosphatidylinositol 4-kinase [Lachnospiraceae bacterium]